MAGLSHPELLPEGTRLVHLGPQKTGTTALQVAMFGAREALAEHGVVYPGDTFRPRRPGWGMGLPGGPPQRPGEEEWLRFADEVRAAGDARVCVSDENYARAKPDQAERIVRDLGDERVHVIAFARRLDRFLPSQWQERVKYGLTDPFERYLERVFDHDDSDWERWHVWMGHDPAALAERWAAYVGPDRFTLVIGDDSDRRQIFRVFGELLGFPDEILRTDANPRRSNRSLSWAETELLREVMALCVADGWTGHEATKIGRAVVAALRAQPAPAGPTGGAVLPDWAYDRVRELSDARIEAVRALPVRVIGDPEHLRVPAERPDPGPVAEPVVPAGAAAAAVRSVIGDRPEPKGQPGPDDRRVGDLGGRDLLRVLGQRLAGRLRRP